MPVKKDTRVITHATPPLVTLRKHKSGFRELQLHCILATCDHEDTLTDGDESITIRCENPVALSRTVDGRIERVCDQHFADFHTPATIEAIIAELDEMLRDDMSTWHGHGQDYSTTTMPDETFVVRIKRDENGKIVW